MIKEFYSEEKRVKKGNEATFVTAKLFGDDTLKRHPLWALEER
jgi:hypothetical protein